MKSQDCWMLWEKARAGLATPEDIAELKERLSTAEGRAEFNEQSTLEYDLQQLLSSGADETNSKPESLASLNRDDSAPSPESLGASPSTVRAPKSFQYSAFIGIAALVAMAFFLSLHLGWVKGPSKNRIIAQVNQVSGEVRVKRGPLHVALRQGMAIKEDDHILTALQSQLSFTTTDGSFFEIGERSRVHLGKNLLEEGFVFQMAKGSVKVQASPQKSGMTFESPYLITRVLGTRFLLRAQAAESEVYLFEGSLKLEGTHGLQSEVQLKAQQQALVSQQQLVVKDDRFLNIQKVKVLSADKITKSCLLQLNSTEPAVWVSLKHQHGSAEHNLDSQLLDLVLKASPDREYTASLELGHPWTLLDLQP